MIVGTAGHIDHGKTTLVRALTGVDTDRLPQEKERGISIELGYAFMDVDAGDRPAADGTSAAAASGSDVAQTATIAAHRIGFIDVPGHERLVHTMLAGATGIDFALLLVAADDGVMPQTREHLAVLSLLGVTRGAVALTKIDRVDVARVREVTTDVGALLAGTALAGAPVLPLSAVSGDGVGALRALLLEAARATPPRMQDSAAFRLAVDRVFTLSGTGTVVTGTVHAGCVRVGDELALVPSNAGRQLRVRSVHAQNVAVQEARAGQRCALALASVAKDEITRGQWLVSPAAALSTDRFDATLTLWHAEDKALRTGTPVHVHLGATDVMGSVALLQHIPADASAATARAQDQAAPQTLGPGETARVQIVLQHPIAAWHGDRLVLRDNSATRTLAGGEVLDPFAPSRYRRTPQRLAELDAQTQPGAEARLAALLAAAPWGVALTRWARAEGLQAGALPPLPADTLRAMDASHEEWALGAARAGLLGDQVVAALRDFHTREPDLLGPDNARLRRLTMPRLSEALWRALLASLQTGGHVGLRHTFVHAPEHAQKLTATDQRIAQKIAPLLLSAGNEGGWTRDLARDAREPEVLMRTTLARLAQQGELHQVVKDLYYPQASIEALAALVRTVAAAGDVTAGSFRDASGLGRKRAVQLLEYFDRVGLLRRQGDVHRLRDDTALFATATKSSIDARRGSVPGGTAGLQTR